MRTEGAEVLPSTFDQLDGARISWFPLVIAMFITLALSIYPPLLTTRLGHPDHLGAMLAFWSMSAGYVRGVGYVPQLMVLRLALSAYACLLALILALWRIAAH